MQADKVQTLQSYKIIEYLDSELLELILDNLYSGIILCNKECKILYINQVYASLLGINNREDAIGKPITFYFPKSRLGKVISNGTIELGQSCSLKRYIPHVVNRIPIKKNNEIYGAILQSVFKDFDSLQDLFRKIKSLNFYRKSLKRALSPIYTFESIIGKSPAISHTIDNAKKYAIRGHPILILGPTGTGKELFAHSIHDYSPRNDGPFVCVNCASFPKDLLESELFGYEPGAFTGASQKGKMGKIELANQGSLFLDEIGDLSLNAQAKLLRVIETKQFDKIGGIEPIPSDFRLIAATNKDLRQLIAKGEFREDLFYRLNVMTLFTPSLAERREDIQLLVRYFLKEMGREESTVTCDALEAIENYPWPGNIRELKNAIEQALSVSENDKIKLENLPPQITNYQSEKQPCKDTENAPRILNASLNHNIHHFEKEVLKYALKKTRYNMTQASKMLEISRSTLYEKCHRYDLI